MRHVYDNNMVAHIWAHQSQTDARSGNGNLSFDGATIKSYWLTIGEIVEDRSGNKVALILTDYTSQTTKQHLGTVRHAVMGVMPWYKVDYLTSHDRHTKNVADMLASYAEMITKDKRRMSLPTWHESHYGEQVQTIREYAERFDVPVASYPDASADWESLVQHHAAREAKRNDPKQIAARDRAAVAQRNRIRLAYVNCTGDFAPGSHKLTYTQRRRIDDMMTAEDRAIRGANLRTLEHATLERYRAGEPLPSYCDIAINDDDRAAHDAAVAVRHAELIAKWRAGENVYVPRLSTAMMRVCGDEIQTSWGARFPVAHGTKAFPLIAQCRAHGREYKRNGVTIHLGHFAIDSIDAGGNVKAGCHYVLWSEIERIAAELGLVAA